MSEIIKREDALSNVMQGLQKRKKTLEKMLPRYLSTDRFFRLAVTQLQKNPKLLECSLQSVIGGIVEAAQCGLELDGRNAHLIPYAGKATFVPDYKGLSSLAWRSEQIRGIQAAVVYEKDEFTAVKGLHQELRHVPHKEPDRGDPIAYYVVIHTTTEGVLWDFMWKWEIDAHRDRYSPASKKGKHSGWVVNYDAMALKTVFKRLIRWAPMSTELLRAVSRDDEQEVGVDQELEIIDLDAETAPETSEKASGLDSLVPEASAVPQKECPKCHTLFDEDEECPKCNADRDELSRTAPKGGDKK
jgi:recombination protein RecT